MTSLFKRLLKEEEGQGMVEYGLIIALVSIAAIAMLGSEGVGGKLLKVFTKVDEKLDIP